MSGVAGSSPMHPIEVKVSPMRPLMVALAAVWVLFFLFLYVLTLRVEAWAIFWIVLVTGSIFCAWRWPFAALLGLIALLPFQPLPAMVGKAAGIPYVQAISGVKEGLFLIAILSGLNRRRRRLQTVDYLLVALVLMAVVSRLFGGYWMGIKDDWELILPFAAGRFLPIPPKYELRWLKIVVTSMSVVAILGVLEYLFVPLKLRLLWLGLTHAANQFSAIGYSGERIASTLSGPAEFGNLCALTLILLVAFRSRLDRRWLAAVGLLLFGLFLSLTRSAWVAAAVGTMLFEFRSGHWRRVLLITTACAALFIALLPALGLRQFYSYTMSGEDPE